MASDVEPPVITLNGEAAIRLTVGDKWNDPGASATDETDGDLSDVIVVAGSVDTATAGLYTLAYGVEDTAGNRAEVSRVVSVVVLPLPPPAEEIPASDIPPTP